MVAFRKLSLVLAVIFAVTIPDPSFALGSHGPVRAAVRGTARVAAGAARVTGRVAVGAARGVGRVAVGSARVAAHAVRGVGRVAVGGARVVGRGLYGVAVFVHRRPYYAARGCGGFTCGRGYYY